jgi:hypothetical protein
MLRYCYSYLLAPQAVATTPTPLILSEGKDTGVLVPLLFKMHAESFYDFPSDLSRISPISSTSTDSSTVIVPAITNDLCLFVEADDV